MLPVIQLGPLSLPTYPLALLLAVWAALAVGAWAARREGLDGDYIYNAGLYGLVTGLVTARLAHVIVYWDAYRTQLLEIFGFNQRAFLPWPGVIACTGGSRVVCLSPPAAVGQGARCDRTGRAGRGSRSSMWPRC